MNYISKIVTQTFSLSLVVLFAISGCVSKRNSENLATISQSGALSLDLYKTEVPIAEIEEVVQLDGAIVAIADYALLRTDIPQLGDATESTIDKYLIENYAFFSKKHIDFTKQSKGYRINTPIATRNHTKAALRPPFYGRALMIPAQSVLVREFKTERFVGLGQGPLMDIKGAGNPEPEHVDDYHGNGQAYFGEAMREYHFQKLVQMLFDVEGKGWQTNPVYAVILLPFSAEHELGAQLRSALIVRKADFRHGKISNHGGFVFYSRSGVLQPEAYLEASQRELALRKYGLTSSVETNVDGVNKFEAVNLQFTRSMSIIDFGSFGVLDKFTLPLHFCDPQYKGDPNQETEPLRHTGFTIMECPYQIEPDSKYFLSRPDQNIAVPKSLWGIGPITLSALHLIPESKRPDQRMQFMDNPSLAGTWLASAFDGDMTKGREEAIKQHCSLMVPVAKKLKIDPAKFISLNKCGNNSFAFGEYNIQLQATLALSGLVNKDQLEALVEERFKQFGFNEIATQSKEFGENLLKQWQQFLQD